MVGETGWLAGLHLQICIVFVEPNYSNSPAKEKNISTLQERYGVLYVVN